MSGGDASWERTEVLQNEIDRLENRIEWLELTVKKLEAELQRIYDRTAMPQKYLPKWSDNF